MSDNINSTLVPTGIYKAVASPVEADGAQSYVQFGITKERTKQVLVQFQIIEGPCSGRKVSWFGFFTEKTWERTIKSLRLCGYVGDDLFDLKTQALTEPVSITVEHSTWDGKTSARVSWVNPLHSGIVLSNPMGSDDLRRFAAAMKSKISKVPSVAKKSDGAPPRASVQEQIPLPSDDDIFQ